MDFYLGSIVLWPMRWIPEYWAVCDGSLLQIQQYQALYSLLGTVYGGNGTTNFALPDLRGYVPAGAPQVSSAGLKYGTQMAGLNTSYGTTSPLPPNYLVPHNHTVTMTQQTLASATVQVNIPAVSNTTGATGIPGTGVSLAQADDSAIGGSPTIYSTTAPNTTLKPFNLSVPGGTVPGQTVTTSTTGASTSANLTVNMPGALILNYIICTNGLYPMRP